VADLVSLDSFLKEALDETAQLDLSLVDVTPWRTSVARSEP
jgi:hypothetical protein